MSNVTLDGVVFEVPQGAAMLHAREAELVTAKHLREAAE